MPSDVRTAQNPMSKNALLFCLLFLLFSIESAAQSVTVVATDMQCPSTGELAWSISGVDPAASVSYEVYNIDEIPRLLVAGPFTNTSLTGLAASTYLVKATISQDGGYCIEEATAIVNNLYENVTVNISVDRRCDVDLIVDPTAGSIASIEVQSGPDHLGDMVNTPPYEFVDLTPGATYDLLITDECGRQQVKSHKVNEPTPFLSVRNYPQCSTELPCNEQAITIRHEQLQPEQYPVEHVFTVHPPNGGAEIVYNFSASVQNYTHVFEYFPNDPFWISYVSTDACGREYTGERNMVGRVTDVIIDQDNCNCHLFRTTNSRGDISIAVNSAPAGADVSAVEGGYTPSENCISNQLGGFAAAIQSNYQICGAMPGDYNLSISDNCGTYDVDVTFGADAFAPTEIRTGYYCDVNTGSILTEWPAAIGSVNVLDGPAGTTGLRDCTENGFVGPLPPGTYDVEYTSHCGEVYLLEDYVLEDIPDHFILNDLEVNCGLLNVSWTLPSNDIYTGHALWHQVEWLDANGNWVFVGKAGSNLVSEAAVNNIEQEGQFRVVRFSRMKHQDFGCVKICDQVMAEFEHYANRLDYVDAFATPCNDGSYSIYSDATGDLPISYDILSIDGVAQVSNPTTDNFFTGLVPGTYVIEAFDGCNRYDKTVEIEEVDLSIIELDLCEGSDAQLFIKASPSFTYSWYNTNDPATILSTTNSLTFTGFSAADVGTYEVNVSVGDCLNQTLSYEVDDVSAPEFLCCPADIMTCDGFATWDTPATRDNCGVSMITNVAPVSGTAFAIGDTEVNITAEDANGNQAVCTFMVRHYPVDPVIELSTTSGGNFSCVGGADHILTVADNSGTNLPLTYLWSDGATTASRPAYFDGTYSVEVSNGICETTVTYEIINPETLESTAAVTQPACDTTTGSIDLDITGGLAPYDITWTSTDPNFVDPGTASLIALAAGDYDYSLVDQNGCTFTGSVTVDAASPINMLSTSVNTSEGQNGGVLPAYYNTQIIEIEGGSGLYDVDVDRQGYVRIELEETDNGMMITVIYADNADWELSITDIGDDCAAAALTISNDSVGNVSTAGNILDIDSVTITGSEGQNGSIQVEVVGGTAPYYYAWDPGSSGGNVLNQDLIENLEPGWYSLVVTDSSNPPQTTEGWYWVPNERRSGRLKTQQEFNSAQDAVVLNAVPNLVSDQMLIQVDAALEQQVQIRLYNLQAQLVQNIGSISTDPTQVNEMSYSVKSHDLPSGVYFVAAYANDRLLTQTKIVIMD